MAVREAITRINVYNAFTGAISSNTTTNGTNIFDTRHEKATAFVMGITAFTDGAYELQVFESDADDMTGETQVTRLQKVQQPLTNPSLAVASGANKYVKLGVYSTKRYLRHKVVSTGVTTGATVNVLAVLNPELSPDETSGDAPDVGPLA